MIVRAAPSRTAALPLEDALLELADQMRHDVTPESRARLLNVSGDLCHDAGQRQRALLYYDTAIDLYLAAGRFAAAASICDKLVRLNPQIVRARCTLAWLAIGRGLDDEAERRVEEYGEAALRLERPTVAQRQLRAMADETDSERVLDAIAHALLKLGDATSADRIFGFSLGMSPHRARVHSNAFDRERTIIARLTQAWDN